MVIEKPIMVAELSINHLGMVKIAEKMIDDVVKKNKDKAKDLEDLKGILQGYFKA